MRETSRTAAGASTPAVTGGKVGHRPVDHGAQPAVRDGPGTVAAGGQHPVERPVAPDEAAHRPEVAVARLHPHRHPPDDHAARGGP